MWRSTLMLSTAMALLLPEAVAAQTDDRDHPQAEPSVSNSGLAEIVVTAQRREESAQRAGVAVDVVGGDSLIDAGISQPSDLGKIVPALNVQEAGGANKTFFLRGVGNFTVNGYSDPAIAVNYDGVYVARPTSTSGLFYDLERIEVLKGPQGTLYGRNATAGAINIIPAKPKIGENSGSASISYGNYNALNAQASLNLGLSDNAAFRIAGNVIDRDGYLSDGTNDEKMQAVRAQLLFEPTPELNVRLAGDYSHVGGAGSGSSYAGKYALDFSTGAYNFVPSGLDLKTGIFDPASQAYRKTLFLGLSGRNAAELDDDIYQDNNAYGLNAEVNWETGIGTFTVIPAWRKTKLDYKFGTPAFIGWIQEEDEQFSLEARLAGKPVGMFDYILGAFYFDETNDGNYTFAQQALNTYQEFNASTKSWAVFGRLTANVTDRFRLIGGLRYTKDRKTFDGVADVVLDICTQRNAFGVPDCPNAPLLPVTDSFDELQAPFIVPSVGQARPIGTTGAILSRVQTAVDSSLKAGEVTWRLAAEYDLAARSLLYASVERGYRSGGFSLAAGYETFAPEYITAYTIGVKNRLLDNRLQLNVEAFWWDYKDQQIGRIGIDANGNQGQFSQNVGQSSIKGFEAGAQFQPTQNTLLAANVQYVATKYDSFVYTEPVGQTPPLNGCANSIANGTVTVDCSGFPAFNAPKWTINLSAQHTFAIGDLLMTPSVDTQFRSKRYVQAEFLPEQLAGSYWQSNAQLAFSRDNANWELAAYVRNIEGDRQVGNAPIYGLGSSLQYVSSAPRTYGVRASVKF